MNRGSSFFRALLGAALLFVFLLNAHCQVAIVDGLQCSSERVLFRLRADGGGTYSRSTGESLLPEDLSRRLHLPKGVGVRNVYSPNLVSGGDRASRALDPTRAMVLELNGNQSVKEMIAHLNRQAEVDYAEPDWLGQGGALPSDPDYSLQWHHPKIQSPEAWDRTQGSSGIIVAVLDTGLPPDLGEFEGRMVPGYDFANDDADPTDDHGHGTAVAGAIAASANNGMLVAGVDWNCRIMPVKVLDDENNGFYSWWAAGIDFATANGARVINFSAGGITPSSTLTRTIQNAIQQGVIFVTITHNDGAEFVRYPGSLPESITTGASNREDIKWELSNWGPQIDLVAPGVEIYTVGSEGSLSAWQGTSLAAPQVAGAASLLLSLNPDLKQSDVETLLVLGAEDQVGDALDVEGFDEYYGWGRLNLLNSLMLAQVRVDIRPVPESGHLQLQWNAPANAASRHPFHILYSNDLMEWAPVNDVSGIHYSGSFATWVDDGSQTGGNIPGVERYYRILVARQPD